MTKIRSIPLSVLVAAAAKVASLTPARRPKATGSIPAGPKPVLLYIGAEFCPICAAERWPMVIALSKFGSFTALKETHSAIRDGNVGTWSFYRASYTSAYLALDAYELYTNQPSGDYYKPLEKPSAVAQAAWSAEQGSNLSFPFLDLDNQAVLTTAQYSPTIVENHSFSSILDVVGSNDNTIGADIDASAAVFTKLLCGITHNQPTDVCSAVGSVAASIQTDITSANGTAAP